MALSLHTSHLPNFAAIGKPAVITKQLTIGSYSVERMYFDCGAITFYENAYTSDFHDEGVRSSSESTITDASSEYAIGSTYTQGDFIKVSSIGLKYRYIGTEDLTVSDAAAFTANHPSAVDARNDRVNADLWYPWGPIEEYKPLNGSSESYITAANGMRIEVDLGSWDFDGSDEVNDDYAGFVGILIDGIRFEDAKNYVQRQAVVEVYDQDDSIQDRFIIYFVGSRIFFEIPIENTWTVYKNYAKVSVKIIGYYMTMENGFGTPLDVYVGSVMCAFMKQVGTAAHNITEAPVNQFQDVEADGVRQEIVTKAVKKASGTILIAKSTYMRTKELLSDGATGGHIFYYGKSEDAASFYDFGYFGDLAYYGTVNNDMPSGGRHDPIDVNISVESRPFYIENRFVPKDSSNGVPIS